MRECLLVLGHIDPVASLSPWMGERCRRTVLLAGNPLEHHALAMGGAMLGGAVENLDAPVGNYLPLQRAAPLGVDHPAVNVRHPA